MIFKNKPISASAFDFFVFRLVVLLCIVWTIPAHTETVQSYPNRPGPAPGNGFASAPLLDPAVVIPHIGETRLEVPAPSAAALAVKTPNQIGVAIDIPAEQRGLTGLTPESAWTTVGAHKYAKLTLHAAGAVSVRAGVTISSGFPGRVFSVSGSKEVESELKRGDGLTWSSTSDGDTLTLLVEIPAGYRYREGDLAIPVISHIDSDPLAATSNGFANIYPGTASCAIDMACITSSPLQAAGTAAMKIVYTRNGSTYTCSGTLLADSARSYKPYVYTANHCIDSQAVADSVVTYWNLQYPTCSSDNSGTPSGVVKLGNGAQLLHQNLDNDHAFLLLNAPPPSGATFLGWSSDMLTSGTAVTLIGHPLGDVKKIAGGPIKDPALTSYSVDGVWISSAWNIDIIQGAAQPGMSGGSVITCDDQGCLLRGGVSTEISSSKACSYPQNISASRFDKAYPAIKQWLGTPTLTSVSFDGWPISLGPNATAPVGKITASFSNNTSRDVGATIYSSNLDLLWLKDGSLFTGVATADTTVYLVVLPKDIGTPIPIEFPIDIRAPEVAIKTAPAIVAGSYISMALKSDGSVWGWGDNRLHTLNDTPLKTSSTPLKVPDISSVKALSANEHVLAVKTDGAVWAWGRNTYGQLGNGTTYSPGTPIRVRGISGVRAIAAGSSHSVALKADGTVWSWGSNELGQFGDGTSSTQISRSIIQAKGVTNATEISTNAYFTVALLQDGTLVAWGNNQHGQLGSVTVDLCPYAGAQWKCSKSPVKIPNLDKVTSIATGTDHVLALRSDGSVWAWGQNTGGQLGDGTVTESNTPKPVPSLDGVIAIAAGNNHSLALKSDGTVWTWGWNHKGGLGYSTTDICTKTLWGSVPCSTSPAKVSALSGVSAISAGSSHSLALKPDGSVWAWGFGFFGQLGNNATADSITPVQIVGPGGRDFLMLGTNQAPAAPADTPTAKTGTTLDCLFTWAEKTHPELLSPSGVATGVLDAYSYRYYPVTSAYLGLSSSDNHVYYLGPHSSNRLTDLGTASTWFATAGCR